MDEFPGSDNETEIKSAKSRLKGIRFGFGTSSSESETEEDAEDEGDEVNNENLKTCDGNQNMENKQNDQQTPIPPLICVTSSLHSYYNLCYPQNVPVYYINQTTQKPTNEYPNSQQQQQQQQTYSTPTLVAFATPTSTSTNPAVTLSNSPPIMSVLPPYGNLPMNQFCIKTTSDNSNTNNYFIFDQNSHKPINVLATQNSSNTNKNATTGISSFFLFDKRRLKFLFILRSTIF